MPDDKTPDPNEKITLTRAELEAALSQKEREATYSDDERKVRAMMREEARGAFEDMFSERDDDDEPDDDADKPAAKRTQKPKGTGGKAGSKSLVDQLLGR